MKTRIYTSKFDSIDFTTMKFSGGEIQVRLEEKHHSFWFGDFEVIIKANIDSSDKLMEILLLTDALRQKRLKRIALVCPYLPYARQDRVCYSGEALSLKVICNIINSQNYEYVEIWDAHSDVTLALLNNVVHIETYKLISNGAFYKDTILIAPDVGAIKRVSKVAKYHDLPMITAEKVRDPKTGEITRTEVNYGDVTISSCKEFLIVDDICDGGRTFIELAKKINEDFHFVENKPMINLYVTHGIFSKGFEVFNGLIDNIYVANGFIDDVPSFVHVGG